MKLTPCTVVSKQNLLSGYPSYIVVQISETMFSLFSTLWSFSDPRFSVYESSSSKPFSYIVYSMYYFHLVTDCPHPFTGDNKYRILLGHVCTTLLLCFLFFSYWSIWPSYLSKFSTFLSCLQINCRHVQCNQIQQFASYSWFLSFCPLFWQYVVMHSVITSST